MIRKLRLCLFAFIHCFCILLSGCSMPERAAELLKDLNLIKEEVLPDYSDVTGEMNCTPYDFPPVDGYYVLHDSRYYHCMDVSWKNQKDLSYSGSIDSMQVNGYLIAMGAYRDLCIPTLYLGNEDQLIFYSNNNILDFYTFAKYEDLGYSLPIIGWRRTVAGYPYVHVSIENEKDPYACSILASATKEAVLSTGCFALENPESYADMRIMQINGTDFSSVYLKNGIISGLNKDEKYLINGTLGSENYEFLSTAEYHFLKEMELYAEAEYEVPYDNTYLIPVPEYLTDGYYMLSSGQMFRLLREKTSFNLYNNGEEDQFNKRSLRLDEEYVLANGGHEDDDGNVYNALDERVISNYSVYSSNELLNRYATIVPDALGFVIEEPEGSEEGTEGEDTEEEEASAIDALVRTCYLFVPQDGMKVPDGTAFYEITLPGTTAPCLVYHVDGGAVKVESTKEEGVFSYIYQKPGDIEVKKPFYVIVYHSPEVQAKIAHAADGFEIRVAAEDSIEDIQSILNEIRASEETAARR